MNRGFFLGALVVLTITVVLFIAGWPPAPCPAKWFVGVLGLLLMLLAFSKRKPLLPPTLAEFPPPHGTTAGQLVLLHEFFDLFQTVEEYSYQPGSEALDLFFRANEVMESKMRECLAAGVPKAYLEKALESRGYLYFSMGAGSGKTFRST